MNTTEKINRIVQQIRNLAEAIDDRNYELDAAGELTREQFEETQVQYRKLKDLAFAINIDHSIELLNSLAPHIEELKDATERLENSRERIERVVNIITISVSIVTAVGFIVAAVLTPGSPTTVAAIRAVNNTISEIIEVTEDEDDVEDNEDDDH